MCRNGPVKISLVFNVTYFMAKVHGQIYNMQIYNHCSHEEARLRDSCTHVLIPAEELFVGMKFHPFSLSYMIFSCACN